VVPIELDSPTSVKGFLDQDIESGISNVGGLGVKLVDG
jgi:hypothetical protein